VARRVLTEGDGLSAIDLGTSATVGGPCRAAERPVRGSAEAIMAYLAGAKLVALVHFGFVVFLFLGGLLLYSHRWLARLHGPCLVYAVLITVVGWSCPLTHLERWLLGRAGVLVYSGEFLPHYVWSRFGLTGSEFSVAAGLIAALLSANFVQYRSLLWGQP